jgi:hypothetical protein
MKKEKIIRKKGKMINKTLWTLELAKILNMQRRIKVIRKAMSLLAIQDLFFR